jgi:hypothetical protein
LQLKFFFNTWVYFFFNFQDLFLFNNKFFVIDVLEKFIKVFIFIKYFNLFYKNKLKYFIEWNHIITHAKFLKLLIFAFKNLSIVSFFYCFFLKIKAVYKFFFNFNEFFINLLHFYKFFFGGELLLKK